MLCSLHWALRVYQLYHLSSPLNLHHQHRMYGLVTLCRKTTVQKAGVQNGRSAEMGNVPIVFSSRVTELHDVTTRNNQLNKTVLFG